MERTNELGERMGKTDRTLLIGFIGLLILLGYSLWEWNELDKQANIYKQELSEIDEEWQFKYDRLNHTFQMYLFEEHPFKYPFNTTYKVVGMAYCNQDIILIDIKDREYYEALETFNHEWLHCKWKEHYWQAR